MVKPVSLVKARLSRGAVSLGVQVMEVGRFWGYRADEASMKKQECLTGEINGRALRPVAVSLHPNLLCLAPFQEQHGSLYYRANVRHMLGSTVEVLRSRTTHRRVFTCSSSSQCC